MTTPESRRHFLTRRVLPVLSTAAFGTLGAAMADGAVKGIESAPYSQIHIKFDLDGDHYIWSIAGSTSGIDPPNELGRGISTVKVAVNDRWYASRAFQPLVNEGLYPEVKNSLNVSVSVSGMAVDIPLDRYYLGTGVSRADGFTDPRFEWGIGVATPEKYTGRIVIRKGLPTGGIRGSMYSSLVILGSNNSGNFADYIFSDCINTTENGTYRIGRDDLGNLVGDTFVKISDSITPGKPFKVVFPEYMQKAQQ